MQDYNIPTIDNQLETFDIEVFNKESVRDKRILTTNNSVIEEDTQSFGYAQQTYPNDSYFSILKLYFSNGKIKEKGVYFNNGSEYGTWYKFSEEGKLIKETNYNQPLNKIGWRYILNYCKRNNIPLTKGYTENGYHTEIYFDKDVEKEDGIWTITWQTAGDKLEEIKLHGASGWQISKKELEFINH
jgi:hypothetical protein